MMDRNQYVTQLIRRAHHASLRRQYGDLEPIMADIFGRKDKLEVLVWLAGEMGGTAFEALLLSGLTHLIQLRDADYARLLELARGHAIATYQLVTFLFDHAHAPGSALRKLCTDLSEIEKSEQLRSRLANDRPTTTVNRMTQRMYDDLKVPSHLLTRFAARFAVLR